MRVALEVLELLRARDLAAWEVERTRCEKQLARLLSVMGIRPDDIEELVNDTFEKAGRHINTFRGDCLVSTWLYRICRTLALDRIRVYKRQPIEVRISEHFGLRSPEGDYVRRRMMQQALESLPPEVATAISLVYIEGFSHKEASERLEVNENALKYLLEKGIGMLREKLR